MTYVKFNTLDDSTSRAELIETIFDHDYDDVPIIGRTDKNYLVAGVAFVDGDSSIRLHHDNADEFGDIVEWSFVENPTTTTNDDLECEATGNIERESSEVKNHIVCAAIRYPNGVIVCGARHYDRVMHTVLEQLDKTSGEYKAKGEQGFIDKYGTFHNRIDAKKIAAENGQVTDFICKDVMYSEDLY